MKPQSASQSREPRFKTIYRAKKEDIRMGNLFSSESRNFGSLSGVGGWMGLPVKQLKRDYHYIVEKLYP